MKIGEKVIIEKTPSGAYRVTLPDGTAFIGGAASTAIALSRAVFFEEACSVKEDKT